MADFRISGFVPEFNCPHRKKCTQHTSSGSSILFARIRCEHCGQDMVILEDKLWVRDQGLNGQVA